jgi:hypothetical protein
MGKRRFLPTRRELYQYINGEVSDDDDDDEDKSHLNAKRYFLKSKRYFLKSKRDNEQQEKVRDSFISFNSSSQTINAYLIFHFFRNKRSSTTLTSI